VPEYDNLLLSHADRSRVIAAEHRERVFTRGSVLVDGFANGSWRIARGRAAAALLIEPFGRMSKAHRAEVAEEGARLLDLAASNADRRDVRFVRPDQPG
jgi:hypothetical protein